MKMEVTQSERIALTGTSEEFGALTETFNEVRNGLDIFPFETRIGSRQYADELWKVFLAAMKKGESVGGEVSIDLTAADIQMVRCAIVEVLRGIDAWEFKMRVGCTREFLDQIRSQLVGLGD